MLYLASDHRGVRLKEGLVRYCDRQGIAYEDLGTSTHEAVDYPDYAKEVARAVQKNPKAKGVLICRSGIGMSIAANRFKGVRAALVHDVKVAASARNDDNANVLVLAAESMRSSRANKILRTWLSTPFSDAARHRRRVRKLNKL